MVNTRVILVYNNLFPVLFHRSTWTAWMGRLFRSLRCSHTMWCSSKRQPRGTSSNTQGYSGFWTWPWMVSPARCSATARRALARHIPSLGLHTWSVSRGIVRVKEWGNFRVSYRFRSLCPKTTVLTIPHKPKSYETKFVVEYISFGNVHQRCYPIKNYRCCTGGPLWIMRDSYPCMFPICCA